MTEKRLPKYLTYDDFRAEYVNWSDDTIRRRIKQDGMPALQEPNGRFLPGPRQELELWFKRRKAQAG